MQTDIYNKQSIQYFKHGPAVRSAELEDG
jgi:hypothetical protein